MKVNAEAKIPDILAKVELKLESKTNYLRI